MKIDLVGPAQRGLAMGLNEAAGYGALGATALLTGYLAASYGLRPEPFYVGIVYAVLGLALSLFLVHDTRGHARLEAAAHGTGGEVPILSTAHVFVETSWRNRTLFSVSPAGLVNNLNDGMSWGLYPLFFAAHGLGLERIGVVKAVYPVVWGLLQVATGPLSDRWGRKGLIAWGMVVQAGGIWLTVLVPSYAAWLFGAVLQGLGTAMVYPTLLAAIVDHAHPTWRASSLGVYRFWRDLGYAVGALLSGIIADAIGLGTAIHVVAGLTLASGIVVAVAMRTSAPSGVREVSGRPTASL
jgi:MFS family permease